MANILLIEPDRILADTYCRTLEKAGHKVSVCSGAQMAILAADRIEPELVILELQLVEHSGIEFLYEFRSYPDWQRTPVIILSQVPPSEFNVSREILTKQLGVAQFLYKPQTNLKTLMTSVEDQLSVKA